MDAIGSSETLYCQTTQHQIPEYNFSVHLSRPHILRPLGVQVVFLPNAVWRFLLGVCSFLPGYVYICVHQQLNNYSRDFLQASSVSVEDSVGLLTISAVYLPPKHRVKQEQIEDFYKALGRWFIAGGDYNAKHTGWGSRLITPRGHEVLKTMERNNLQHLSTGEPTYWPSDRNKLPHLVDFHVTKGVPQDCAVAKSCSDLSSDHSPILITLTVY
jgi:hypothetical protein